MEGKAVEWLSPFAKRMGLEIVLVAGTMPSSTLS